MGQASSSHSSSPRTVTVINESGAIRISESAANKVARSAVNDEWTSLPSPSSSLSTGQFAAPLESLTLRKQHAEEIHALEESYRVRMKEYEDQNKYLWSTTTTKLSKDLDKIEEKYTSRMKYDVVCPDVEKAVESCYQENNRQPLKCSDLVKKFSSCVREARHKALTAL